MWGTQIPTTGMFRRVICVAKPESLFRALKRVSGRHNRRKRGQKSEKLLVLKVWWWWLWEEKGVDSILDQRKTSISGDLGTFPSEHNQEIGVCHASSCSVFLNWVWCTVVHRNLALKNGQQTECVTVGKSARNQILAEDCQYYVFRCSHSIPHVELPGPGLSALYNM